MFIHYYECMCVVHDFSKEWLRTLKKWLTVYSIYIIYSIFQQYRVYSILYIAENVVFSALVNRKMNQQ